jgi:Yip1-like protein
MNLVERVKRILLSPQTEWEVIDAEPTTPAELYTRYIMPLAAIGPVSQLIGYSVFGFMGYRVPIGTAITYALATYIMTLIGTLVLALVIDGLAPTFSGKRSQASMSLALSTKIQALKVAAYSSTAAWVAGIFALVPVLSVLSIVGLYSLYLLYLGLPTLMKAPKEKAIGYTVVVIIAAILIFIVTGTIAGRFMMAPTVGMNMP